jgi:hypothetical protein
MKVVGFKVLTAVVVKSSLIWDITPYSLLKVNQLLISWGGVRLSPLGMSATMWPIIPAPDDR